MHNHHLKFKQRRKNLIEELRSKGIKDERVLAAFDHVPRHVFVSTAFEGRAYNDTALPIGKHQTISQPFTIARQMEMLDVFPGEKVLEIGTGSGYQAALLCELGASVYSIERYKELYEKTRKTLHKLGYSVQLKQGDGTLGWSAYSPYDAIIVTAGAPSVPENMIQQLGVGGRLVIPVGDRDNQKMVKVHRLNDNEYKEEHFRSFKFVPLIGEKGWGES
jgi:protein-L-isoaspartate(D-aspartate) O-methyltransferase